LKSDPAAEPPADPLTADTAAREEAAKKHGRAGRDLTAAISVGLSLVAMIIASLYFYKDSFAVIVSAALVVALFELKRALSTAGVSIPVVPVLIGGLAMMLSVYWGEGRRTMTVFAITVLSILIYRLRFGARGFVLDATAGVFVLSYLFVMGTFVLQMLRAEDGEWRIVAFIACTIGSDIGGYAAGVFFGKHPMAPQISPKKSWEGFAGSLVTGMIVGTIVVSVFLDGHWWVGIILGAASVIMATAGDLCESVIKRDIGVKDMGHLLPGHGGIMDRLDSLIAVAPVSYLVMATLL
jgi:phosphatidate cytidylyltransferase